MESSEKFAEYFVLSIGIIIFIGLPICSLVNCLCCRKKREYIYLEIP